MKHRFTIPVLEGDSRFPDIGGWAHRFGWTLTTVETRSAGFMRGGGESRLLRITLTPRYDSHLGAEITIGSGATLVYDDADRTMAVSVEPEPQDAVPAEPEDAVPETPACRAGVPRKGPAT